MPDNPMKNDDQVQRKNPDQGVPMTQPDKSNEGSNKDRKASDEDLQKKQGNPDRENPNR